MRFLTSQLQEQGASSQLPSGLGSMHPRGGETWRTFWKPTQALRAHPWSLMSLELALAWSYTMNNLHTSACSPVNGIPRDALRMERINSHKHKTSDRLTRAVQRGSLCIKWERRYTSFCGSGFLCSLTFVLETMKEQSRDLGVCFRVQVTLSAP